MSFKLFGAVLYLPVIVICMIISQIYFERYWIAYKNTRWGNVALSTAICVTYFLQEYCLIQLSMLNINEIAFVQVVSLTMVFRENIYKVWWWLLVLTPLFVYTVEYFSGIISFQSWWYWLGNAAFIFAFTYFFTHWQGLPKRIRYFCAIFCLALLGICSLAINSSLSLANVAAATIGLFFIALFEDRRYISEVKNANKLKMLRRESERDDLTGLLNYRALSQEINRLTKDKNINKIIIGALDIDHFKHINDTYGHFVGNEVLNYFSTVFRKQIHAAFPNHGYVYRFGGEEFTIVVTNHSLEDVYDLLHVIEDQFNNEPIKTKEGIDLTISFSCSVTSHIEDETLDTTLRRADKMLYSVKNNGRGWVIADHHSRRNTKTKKMKVGEYNYSQQ